MTSAHSPKAKPWRTAAYLIKQQVADCSRQLCFCRRFTGAHTLTCLLCRNRSRRNRDAPIWCPATIARRWEFGVRPWLLDDAYGRMGASRRNWLGAADSILAVDG